MPSVNDKMDRPFRNSERFSQLQLGYSSTRVQTANCNNFGGCKFGKTLSLSTRGNLSSLPVPVVRIVGVCSKPEMRPPNTRRVVASMKNQKSVRDWAKSQYPACARREHHGADVSIGCDLSVTSFLTVAGPKPAAVCNLHLVPKSFNEGWGKALRSEEVSPIVGPLDQFHRCNRVTLPVVRSTRGQIVCERIIS